MTKKIIAKEAFESFETLATPIWLSRKDRSRNRFLVFRRSFTLSQTPVQARLEISAYAMYEVAINGVIVGRGPDPSNPNRYYVDGYEVASLLRQGDNVLSILVYTFGPKLPWPECTYLFGESGWLRFALACGSQENSASVVVSDSACSVRVADAWQTLTPEYTELRAGFKEYYNANRCGYEEILSGKSCEPADGWQAAVVLRPEDLRFRYHFLPKEIPFLRERDVRPTAAFAIDGGFAYGFTRKRGWQVENSEALIAGYPVQAYRDCFRQGEPNFPRSREESDAHDACLIHRESGSGTPSLLLDFGGMQYGLLELELETEKAGSMIELGYGETLALTRIDRYTTRSGRQTFHPFHFRAGRYVLLSFSRLLAPVRLLSVRFRRWEYPVPESQNAFTASRPALERIADVAENTLQLNMHSHFEDCPWREQKLYLGDMLPEALGCYYRWGEYRFVRKCLWQLSDQNRPDGWISNGPGFSRGGLAGKQPIIDFPIYFVFELRDYVLFSGDRETLEGLYPRAVGVLEKYLALGLEENGLVDIGEADSFDNWCVINWNDVFKKGQCAALNFQIARGVAAAREMAVWLGRADDAVRWERLLDTMRAATERALWNPQQGLYRDARYQGKSIDHFSTETNTLAILSGLLDPERTRALVQALVQGRLALETPTAFFNAQVAEALLMHRQTAAALQLIEKHWGAMLERGGDAFWEMFVPSTPPGAFPPKGISLCHGWACGPAYLFPAYLLGIRPLEPGFRTFAVDPQPADLEALSGSVPTPQGPITLRYASGHWSLTHPQGTVPVFSEMLRETVTTHQT